ncbi:MAG: TrbG/VirB9 family P-type conjugative transfer protein [Trebonia sp.]
MRAVFAIALLAALPVTAFALTTPAAGPHDPRVRTAQYRAEDVIALHAAVGKALLVQLPAGETVTDVTLSDTADMLPPVIVANSVTFKPKAAMPPGPLFIYARDGDGERIFKFEFDASQTQTDTQPIAVIITDPAAAAKARAVAARKAAEQRRKAEVRAALRDAPASPRINTDYTARGPAALLGR